MTELRKRMIEDMQLAGLSRGTLEAYVRSVRQLAAHYRLSLDRISERQLRDYLIHLRDVHLSEPLRHNLRQVLGDFFAGLL